jgi:hypothetical protein
MNTFSRLYFQPHPPIPYCNYTHHTHSLLIMLRKKKHATNAHPDSVKPSFQHMAIRLSLVSISICAHKCEVCNYLGHDILHRNKHRIFFVKVNWRTGGNGGLNHTLLKQRKMEIKLNMVSLLPLYKILKGKKDKFKDDNIS